MRSSRSAIAGQALSARRTSSPAKTSACRQRPPIGRHDAFAIGGLAVSRMFDDGADLSRVVARLARLILVPRASLQLNELTTEIVVNIEQFEHRTSDRYTGSDAARDLAIRDQPDQEILNRIGVLGQISSVSRGKLRVHASGTDKLREINSSSKFSFHVLEFFNYCATFWNSCDMILHASTGLAPNVGSKSRRRCDGAYQRCSHWFGNWLVHTPQCFRRIGDGVPAERDPTTKSSLGFALIAN